MLKAPETFGESALAAAEEVRTRATHVYAGADGATLLVWSVGAIETLVGFSLQEASTALNNRRMLEEAAFGGRPLADGLSKEQEDALLGGLEEHFVADNGTTLVSEGEMDANLYLIRSGEVCVTWAQTTQTETDKGALKKVVAAAQPLLTLGRGKCFGEQALVPKDGRRRHKRKLSVVVTNAPLVLLVLSPAVIESLMAHDWFCVWLARLSAHITDTGTPGVDAIVAESLEPHSAKTASGSRLPVAASAVTPALAAAAAADLLGGSRQAEAEAEGAAGRRGRAAPEGKGAAAKPKEGSPAGAQRRRGAGQSSRGGTSTQPAHGGRSRAAGGAGAQGAQGARNNHATTAAQRTKASAPRDRPARKR